MEPAAAARRRLRACVGGRLDRRPAVGGLVFTLRLSGRASSPCRWPPRHASQRTGGRGDGSTTAPSRSRRFRRDRLSAPAPLAAGATWLSLAGHLGGRAAWPPSRATATGGPRTPSDREVRAGRALLPLPLTFCLLVVSCGVRPRFPPPLLTGLLSDLGVRAVGRRSQCFDSPCSRGRSRHR